MGFHMHTYPYNISEFMNYSICRMGKKYNLPLINAFFSPILGQMTINDCIHYFREYGNEPFRFSESDQSCKHC